MRLRQLYAKPPFPFACQRNESHLVPLAELTENNDITIDTPTTEKFVKFLLGQCLKHKSSPHPQGEIDQERLTKLVDILKMSSVKDRLQQSYVFYLKNVYYLMIEAKLPAVSPVTVNHLNDKCPESWATNIPSPDEWLSVETPASSDVPTPPQSE